MSVPNTNSTASLANWSATTESEQLWNIWNATNASGGGGGNSDVAVGPDGVTRVPLNVNAGGELKVNVDATVDADLAQIENKLDTIIGIETPQAADVAEIKNKLNSSIAVTGTFYQATQPVSATSLPLPTGAATAANQINGGPQLGSGVITATTQRVTLATDGLEVTNSTAIKNNTANIPSKGAATIANSTPVNIASDQTVPVSGPLTDTQLRATAVPVAPAVQLGSGVITATTQRVVLATDGQAVTSLSTIATNTTKIGTITPVTGTATTTSGSTIALAANNATKQLTVQNTATSGTLYVGVGATATTSSLSLAAGQGYEFPIIPSTQAIYLLGSANVNYVILWA
jgi:hypothetical protein